MQSQKLVVFSIFSSFGVGLVSFYCLSKYTRRGHLLKLLQVFFDPKRKGIMGNGDGGGGVRGFLSRIYYCLMLYVIGVKWGLIEIFTKHRKMNIKELPLRVDEVVVITGGARGIGASVVKMLLQAHMHVIIGCRSILAGTELVNQIRRDGITWGKSEVIPLDLTSLTSVRQFASQVLSKNVPIHILINNAGIMFCPYTQTLDGLESQFQVNYLGHFLLTNMLLPRLTSAGTTQRHARIVNVSSCAHYGGKIDFNDLQMERMYSRYKAYMTSKLMQVISSTDLNGRLERAGVKVNSLSCHPGMVRTDLYQHLGWFKALHFFVKLLFKTPEQGADVVAYTALSPEIEKEGGIFIANSAKWSPNSEAFDTNLQNQLWDISTELVGMEDYNFNKDSNGTTSNKKELIKVSLN